MQDQLPGKVAHLEDIIVKLEAEIYMHAASVILENLVLVLQLLRLLVDVMKDFIAQEVQKLLKKWLVSPDIIAQQTPRIQSLAVLDIITHIISKQLAYNALQDFIVIL